MSRQLVIGGRVAFILVCAFYIVSKLFDTGLVASLAIAAGIGCVLASVLYSVSRRDQRNSSS